MPSTLEKLNDEHIDLILTIFSNEAVRYLKWLGYKGDLFDTTHQSMVCCLLEDLTEDRSHGHKAQKRAIYKNLLEEFNTPRENNEQAKAISKRLRGKVLPIKHKEAMKKYGEHLDYSKIKHNVEKLINEMHDSEELKESNWTIKKRSVIGHLQELLDIISTNPENKNSTAENSSDPIQETGTIFRKGNDNFSISPENKMIKRQRGNALRNYSTILYNYYQKLSKNSSMHVDSIQRRANDAEESNYTRYNTICFLSDRIAIVNGDERICKFNCAPNEIPCQIDNQTTCARTHWGDDWFSKKSKEINSFLSCYLAYEIITTNISLGGKSQIKRTLKEIIGKERITMLAKLICVNKSPYWGLMQLCRMSNPQCPHIDKHCSNFKKTNCKHLNKDNKHNRSPTEVGDFIDSLNKASQKWLKLNFELDELIDDYFNCEIPKIETHPQKEGSELLFMLACMNTSKNKFTKNNIVEDKTKIKTLENKTKSHIIESF